MLARHGLLLEVLVIVLVFFLCRPGCWEGVSKEKTNMKRKKRRSSIEVGCLPNGQLGSMMAEVLGWAEQEAEEEEEKERQLAGAEARGGGAGE